MRLEHEEEDVMLDTADTNTETKKRDRENAMATSTLTRRLVRATTRSFVLPPRAYALRSFASESSASDASASGAAAAAAGAAAAAPPPPADAAAALRAEVEALTKKLKEAKDAQLYQLAEMENVRRIASADVRRAREYACQPMAKSLLLALDNLDSALRAAAPALEGLPAGAGAGAGAGAPLAKPFTDLVEGLRATHRIFVKVLGEHGAVQFGAVGDKFDANKFDAISLVPAAAAAGADAPQAGHVHSVLQSGYMFKDRVMRPCQCLVVEGKAK